MFLVLENGEIDFLGLVQALGKGQKGSLGLFLRFCFRFWKKAKRFHRGTFRFWKSYKTELKIITNCRTLNNPAQQERLAV